MSPVTVGIDIGSSSTKALAVDDGGQVVARTRVAHDLRIPAPDRLEHDANQAWRRGVRRAWRELSDDLDVAAVSVAAMVPTLAAVDGRGIARTPGLLYGDARGRGAGADGGDGGEVVGFLRWCAEQEPGARGYWPAQAVANAALGGRGAIGGVTAMSATPLFGGAGWDEQLAAGAGVDVAQLAEVVADGEVVGETDGRSAGVPIDAGTIDAFAEQLVAGADRDGDVLVILGTTLICWVVVPEWVEAPGLWTVPHTVPGKMLVGGPSNAGGLFLDWVRGLVGSRPSDVDPARVPVWVPYVRGERVPLHDPDRRASLSGLDLTHGTGAVRRAAFEASGFVVRHVLDLAGVEARRVVATGGGVRVPDWLQAVADCTGLPVDVVAVPEGAALGAAWLARMTVDLEDAHAGAGRWARTSHRVEPDPRWLRDADVRYRRYRELAGPAGEVGLPGLG